MKLKRREEECRRLVTALKKAWDKSEIFCGEAANHDRKIDRALSLQSGVGLCIMLLMNVLKTDYIRPHSPQKVANLIDEAEGFLKLIEENKTSAP